MLVLIVVIVVVLAAAAAATVNIIVLFTVANVVTAHDYRQSRTDGLLLRAAHCLGRRVVIIIIIG